MTYAYSYMVIPPIVAHASEKVLAKQWLQAYQIAPIYVPPLIVSGALANAYLAYHASALVLRCLYSAAALLTFSIMPWTLFHFEPGINGAGKWKVQQILGDEADVMPVQKGLFPSPYKDTGTLKAKKWAEGVDMKELAETWAQLNANRYRVAACGLLLSMGASCWWLCSEIHFPV